MESKKEHINPKGLFKSPAFSQIVTTQGSGKTIYIGGQNAVNDKAELVIKQTNMKLCDMNMFVCGPSAWTTLPVDIRKSETLSGFKRQIRNFEGFIHVR